MVVSLTRPPRTRSSLRSLTHSRSGSARTRSSCWCGWWMSSGECSALPTGGGVGRSPAGLGHLGVPAGVHTSPLRSEPPGTFRLLLPSTGPQPRTELAPACFNMTLGKMTCRLRPAPACSVLSSWGPRTSLAQPAVAARGATSSGGGPRHPPQLPPRPTRCRPCPFTQRPLLEWAKEDAQALPSGLALLLGESQPAPTGCDTPQHGILRGGGAGAPCAPLVCGPAPLATPCPSPSGRDLCGVCPQPRPTWSLLLVQCQQAFAGRMVVTAYQWDHPSTVGVQAAVPSPFLLLSSRERFPALLMAATWPSGILR